MVDMYRIPSTASLHSRQYLQSSGVSSSRSCSRMCNELHAADLATCHPLQRGRYPLQPLCDQFNLVRLYKKNVRQTPFYPRHIETTCLDQAVRQQIRKRRIHLPRKLFITKLSRNPVRVHNPPTTPRSTDCRAECHDKAPISFQDLPVRPLRIGRRHGVVDDSHWPFRDLFDHSWNRSVRRGAIVDNMSGARSAAVVRVVWGSGCDDRVETAEPR